MNIQYLFTTSFIIAIFRCTPEKENYQQQMRVNNEQGNERRDREMAKDVETLPCGNTAPPVYNGEPLVVSVAINAEKIYKRGVERERARATEAFLCVVF